MAWLLTLSMLLTVFSPLSALADDLGDIVDETDIVCGEDTDYLAQASDIATCANVVLTADEIASYFRSRVGQAYDNGMCMRFVREGFQALGGPLSSACCAYNYGNSHIQSTDIDTIPIGADVFFGNCGGGPCKSCHSTYYGHIGVYVGNDQFVHATGGKVQITSLKGSNWKNKFRGWGYHGGITVTGGSNNLPILCVDIVQGGQNHIRVRGWAFDPDNTSAKLAVHVYINKEPHEIIASKYHDQGLDDTFHCGTDHGFDQDILTDETGDVTVTIYAIDAQDDDQHSEPFEKSTYKNPTTVTVTSDKTGPTITNAKITDVDSTGYTVTCTVTDTNGVNRVQFPTWTKKNDQDDLLSDWEVNPKASGTRNGNTFTFRVKTSDHNNESGVYYTHIYAYDNSYRGNKAGAVTLTATVPPPTVAVIDVSLNKTSLSFTGTGSSQTLTATVSPSNATNKTITWSSSNTSVATVSNGVVKAVGFGTTTITAKSNNGKTASCKVTVNPIQPTGIKATPETSTLYGLNGTVKLTANVMPSNATNKAVTWSSNNTSVATVSSDGTVKAVGYGTAVITAKTVNGLTSNCTITVKKVEVTSLTIATQPTKTSYYVGDTLNTAGLTLKATYTNGTAKTISSGFTCNVSKLTSTGTQTVTVSYGGKTVSFKVSVTKAPQTAPAGLKAAAPSTSYTADGTITGTTAAMEWTAKGSTAYTACTGNTVTGLAAGTYLVRYAETATHLASKAAEVTVPAYVAVFQPLTLSFDPTDGVLDLTDTPEKTVYRGEAYGRLPEPTADGMVFLGWYTESGKRITSLTTCDLTGDTTVSARWALASAEGWNFDETTGTLTLDGSGAMKEYTSAAEAPWYGYRDSIEHLVVKSGVTSLSSYAFVGCQNLADVTLPDTLQTIGTMTFYGCDKLDNVTIPASVRTIGSYAFADALSLSRITFAGDAPEFGTGVFTFRILTAYYPVYASGWETVVDGRYDFGGSITWVRSSESSLAAEEPVLLSAVDPDEVPALDWTL